MIRKKAELFFEKCCATVYEVAEIKEKLKGLDDFISPSTSSLGPVSKQRKGYAKSPVEKQFENREEQRERIIEQLKLINKRKKIMQRFLKEIKDSSLKKLVWFRFVEGLTWNDLIKETGLNYHQMRRRKIKLLELWSDFFEREKEGFFKE